MAERNGLRGKREVVVTGASTGVGVREPLAWAGYDARQTPERVNPDRLNNLYEPLTGDYGAHGRFDEGAITFSLQSWANRHRGWLSLTGVLLVHWRQDDWATPFVTKGGPNAGIRRDGDPDCDHWPGRLRERSARFP